MRLSVISMSGACTSARSIDKNAYQAVALWLSGVTPPSAWRYAHYTFEYASEVRLIREPAHIGDVGEGKFVLKQKMPGAINPSMDQPSMWWKADRVRERAGKMR